jgi:hypothetical protein
MRLFLVSSFYLLTVGAGAQTAPELVFDHNHTFDETVTYLHGVVKSYPKIARIHTIGKSFLGNDLLVLEITNEDTGKALEKPGYWLDGNLHASEVFGAEACLKTIDVLVKQYGNDPDITHLVDTRTIYIMPKLNPDGSDHYLKNPDRMRSSVRPHDGDRDGLKDEDPPEDLDGDGYITMIRVKDELGPMKTSPDDPRLMVERKEDEKGEWRVYTEGTDNDGDGDFNEDGVGGLDINRNWPSQWQQEHIQSGAGPYPLSEPETRAVAEFLLSHRNVTGIVNHHMSGDFLYRPPLARHFDVITGEEHLMAPEDDAIYKVFGDKYSEILNNQEVRKVYGRSAPPRRGAIWGVMIGWGYDHYGVYSFVPEIGRFPCDYDDDGEVTEVERLKWNDTEMDGKIFVDWKPFDHPQLGEVEIGGFIRKIYSPEHKTYINLMCYPSDVYEDFLAKHAKWNIYLASMSPWVRLTKVDSVPGDAGYFKVTAQIQNQGFLPTNITQQAIRNLTAKTVKATILLENASLVSGKETVDLGHLAGNTPRSASSIEMVEWMVKAGARGTPKATVKVISEKAGTHTEEIVLKK